MNVDGTKKTFAPAMKIVKVASVKKFVHLVSEIATTQENFTANLHFVGNFFTTKFQAIDALACSLNYFAHWVVNNKQFSTLAFKVANHIFGKWMFSRTFIRPTGQLLLPTGSTFNLDNVSVIFLVVRLIQNFFWQQNVCLRFFWGQNGRS